MRVIKIPAHLFFVMSLLLIVGSCDSSGGPPPAMVQKSDEPIDGPEQDPNVVQVVGDLGDPLFGLGLDDDPVSEDVVKVGDLGAPSFGLSLDNAPHKADDESGGIGNDDYTDRDLDRAYFRYENLADWLGECPHCGAPDAYSGEDYGCKVCHAYLDAGNCKNCAIYLADYMDEITPNYIGFGGSNSLGNRIQFYLTDIRGQIPGTDAWIRPSSVGFLEGRNSLIDTRIGGSFLYGIPLQYQDYGTLYSSRTQELLQDLKNLPANGNLIAPGYDPTATTGLKQQLLEDAKNVPSTGNPVTPATSVIGGRRQELLEDAKGLNGIGNTPTSTSTGSKLTTGGRRQELLDEAKMTPSSSNASGIGSNRRQELLEGSKGNSFNTKNTLEEKSFKNSIGEKTPRSTFTDDRVLSQQGTTKSFAPLGKKTNTFTGTGTRAPTSGKSFKMPGTF